MTLIDTVERMKELIEEMLQDLEKGERGNKTAAQRVRTATIEFGKVARVYRKESMEKAREKK